jgi:hypothetical protein
MNATTFLHPDWKMATVLQRALRRLSPLDRPTRSPAFEHAGDAARARAASDTTANTTTTSSIAISVHCDPYLFERVSWRASLPESK